MVPCAVRLATLRAKHAALAPVFTERSRRLWAATEARALGHGGIALVARATGISRRRRFSAGCASSTSERRCRRTRTRRPGGGRKRATDLDATLLRDLDALVEPTAPGDPDSPLRWTCKSTRTLAVALQALGHSRQPHRGRRVAARPGLQPAGQRRRRAKAASIRSRRAVSVHRATRARGPAAAAAGDLGGHEEEGTGRATSRMPAARGGRRGRPSACACTTSSFRRPPDGRQGHSLRRLRSAPQRRLGQRRDRPRHRELRGAMRFAAGGSTWGARRIAQARSLLITADAGGSNGARAPPLEVGTAAARQSHRASPSRSVTSRRARASGTRSSIACSRTSP